jgi:hypothetical protein
MFSGDFNHDHYTDILFYYNGDGNWWLGQGSSAGTLTWSWASNTNQIGSGNQNLLDSGHKIYMGDFDGDGKTDALFYHSNGDFYLGKFNSSGTLQWGFVGNVAGFGNLLDSHQIFIGDFNGDGRSDVLFNYVGDGNWFIGKGVASGALSWSYFGNTAGYGNVLDASHRTFLGRFNLDGYVDVLIYDSRNGNWYLGAGNSSAVPTWTLITNTAGFGNLLDGKHKLFSGDFMGSGINQLLFLDNLGADKNLWLGVFWSNNTVQWPAIDTTGTMYWPQGYGNGY